MRLTIVGASGSFPGPAGPASCYLVRADGFAMVLDLGSGALGALATHLDIYALDAVLLSHLHPDHCIDMCAYYVARRYCPGGAAPRLDVWGPTGTADRLARGYDIASEPGMQGQFRFSTWTRNSYEIGPFRVSVDRVDHPVETWGIRVEHDGRSLTYSGDTGECPVLVELARDADVFLCEASFVHGRDVEAGVHLSGHAAGAAATAAGARRLLLTHVPPWNDPQVALAEAAATYSGPLELAVPGATYDV